MSSQQRLEELAEALHESFDDGHFVIIQSATELTLEVPRDRLLEVMGQLKQQAEFSFDQCVDVCGVDYSAYGQDEWTAGSQSDSGFSRGVERGQAASPADPKNRFAAVYHLLSVGKNHRLRVRTFLDAEDPVVPSVIGLWASANWFEREAFDLYGILFEGHPDLRRILTDYGFIGHPFRKDFPLGGHVEMRYDAEQQRVIYEPVQLEERVLVPRMIRDDFRYENGQETPDAEEAKG
jgi:NADH-quinone oxidoreductase subunit C